MINVCVLGNSHVASLYQAWTNIIHERYSDVNFDFYAERGTKLYGLFYDNGVITTNDEVLENALNFTSNNKMPIDISFYDVFIIYGSGIKPYFASNGFYSEAVLNQSIKDNTNNVLGIYLLNMLREATNKKIYFGHNPLVSRGISESKKNNEDYRKGISFINKRYYNNKNSMLISQPDITIVNGRNTKPIYTSGSRKLSIGKKTDEELHPELDNVHMNSDFGVLWLEETLNYIEKDILSK
ncbi:MULTISPECIES: hypothetical protein [Cobetia]|uniref:hypothetical protein n=1 Tax=Cobetia TaxID=204286 RepID=UPI001583AD0D|nr:MULTISPECIES: hypothetical protein [Cobetia]MDI4661944.1 hypothetical protein [Cobetia sp. BMC6]NUJ57506.1 hypothetical protein [Cobetia marina]